MEMLALLQGNYGVIQGLATKMRTVLTKNMVVSVDTPENRRALAAKEGEKAKAMITIPRQIQSHIHEGFEPLLVAAEMIDKFMIIILNAVMDFDD